VKDFTRNSRVHALIPAAGRGKRYGGDVLKQYLPVCGSAVLAHAIRLFQFHPFISGVTVILAEDDHMFEAAVGDLARVVDRVTGGDTRAESVRNGLTFIANKYPATDWVLIHDAARPCLPAESLDELLEVGLESADGAILALPIGDTLKRAGSSNEITATVDRTGLWAAQTPQIFKLEALTMAIDKAQHAGIELTDEASAMEFTGAKPVLVMGSAANIKITNPTDLAIAEALLSSSNPGSIKL
jgi:2-C-methyl-D-erythritol 4-phosphate cytidylyltransferase